MPKFEMPAYASPSALDGCKRALTRYFERIEVARVDRMLNEEQLSAYVTRWTNLGHSPGDDSTLRARKVRTEVWLRDSLLWTLEEIERGDYTHALRGLVQAAGYAGKVGHDSVTSDCFNALKNCLEAVTSYVTNEGKA
jgi:hypothetical protein